MSHPRSTPEHDGHRAELPARGGAWRGYAVAVASVVLATLLMFGLYDVLGVSRGQVPFIFFFVAVLLSARYGGRGPALLSIALSSLSADYFFVSPAYALALNPAALLQVFVFVCVSLFIAHLTERSMRAEAAAHASEESLSTTLGSIGDAVIATDTRGRVTFMNPVAEKLTGFAAGEARGRDINEVFRILNEETRAAVESPVAKVLREGGVVGLANHTVLVSKSGAEIPIDDSGAPIRDHGGRVTGVVMVFHDTTERRRAEEKLRRRERELSDFIENATVGLHWVGPDGKIIWANRAELDLLGYAADEYIGHHIAEFHADADVIDDILKRLTCKESLDNYEARLRCKDGSLRHVLINSNVLWDEKGEFIHTRCFTRDVTERKQAEELLRASEERLRAIADSASDAIITIDEESRILFINPTGERVFGYERGEMLGQSLTMLMPEYLRRIHETSLRRYAETGRRHISWESVELPGLHRDGREISLEVSFSEFTTGGRRYFTGIARDVGERKRAQEALRESEHQYRALADAMPQIVWTARPDGYLDYYNRRWFEYTGMNLEQTEGWGWQPVLHPDDVEHCLRCWATAVETGDKYNIEYRFKRASDGQYRWHLGRAVPMRDEAGRVVKWFGAATDIHDQKQAAERSRFLAEAGEVLASSLDYEKTLERLARFCVSVLGDHCLIDVVGDDGRIARVAVSHVDAETEEFIQALRDYPPDVTRDVGVHKVLRGGTPEVVGEVNEEVMRALARDDRHLGILRRLDLASFMTVPLIARERIIGALTFGATGERREYRPEDVAFAGEIASRAALAIDNARLYRGAQEANRSKDEFLATLSHELRTPLTPILGWTHMLKAGRLSEREAAHGVGVIENNALALTRLINDLLDMSSILSGKMSIEHAPVNLGEVIGEAVETARTEAERRGISLEVAANGAQQAVVSGDRTRLVQVFWNLLNNAVKFSPDGGSVTISCGAENGDARVEVADEGAGIEAEFLPHVFERFRQADGSPTRAHGGLGIGLALVKSFAEAHGGSVTAESRGEGLGSRFVVRLPLLRSRGADFGSRTEEQFDEQSATRDPRPATPKACVLLIEDSRDTLDMLRVAFAARGYETVMCASATEALRLAPTLSCDIIISDIGLPQVDGYELIKRLREVPHLRDVPAVALTGYAAAKDAEAALSAGFDLHVPKPVDPGDLANTVDRLMNEKSRRKT